MRTSETLICWITPCQQNFTEPLIWIMSQMASSSKVLAKHRAQPSVPLHCYLWSSTTTCLQKTELLITASQEKNIISPVWDLNSCLAEGELPVLLSEDGLTGYRVTTCSDRRRDPLQCVFISVKSRLAFLSGRQRCWDWWSRTSHGTNGRGGSDFMSASSLHLWYFMAAKRI